MRYLLLLHFLCSISLASFAQTADSLGISYQYQEMPVYGRHERNAGQTVLYMDYASPNISNARHWQLDPRQKRVYEVDLVFTNYPLNRAKWRTDYDWLLKKRVEALQTLIPDLANNKSVKWNLILQTDCASEDIAKQRFHGAVVKYKLMLNNKLRETLSSISGIIAGKEPFQDSVVFKVLDRNRHWQHILLVNDWTGSMYEYGAQAVYWHRLHLKAPRIGHFVFFNDGNMLPDDEKRIGETGGLYAVEADSLPKIIQTMKEVMLSGYGGDDPENDIEALRYAIDQHPNFGQLVLIADNKSGVRDMALLAELKVPVRVVLCGVKGGIHPDYLEIARATGGSIHTAEADIERLEAHAASGEPVEIMGIYYFWSNGRWKALGE